LIGDFFTNLTQAISARKLEKSEEFILNAISCTTNILFYDTASAGLLADQTRVQLFETFKQFMLATQNEEIQIESARVISNLSRHSTLCDHFLED
jgi:hypothetical protein